MRAQGLPVNIIVLTALALIVLVVVAVFFITGMSGGQQAIQIVNATQAECNSLCGTIQVSAFNFDDCTSLNGIGIAQDYANNCEPIYGNCKTSLRNGQKCDVPE